MLSWAIATDHPAVQFRPKRAHHCGRGTSLNTTVAFVGTHDPRFGRVAVLAEGLRQRGLAVIQCVEPAWGTTDARVAAARRGLFNPALGAHLLGSYARLARRLRAPRPRPDVLIAGYPGQLDVLLLRSLLPGVPIVLDGFIGLDETLADRGLAAPGSAIRALAATIDRLAFRRADRVIVDTAAHARRFTASYGLDPRKAVIAPVGSWDPGLDLPGSSIEPHPLHGPEKGTLDSATAASTGSLNALYFGGFIPLHGVPVILDAARQLGPESGITFDLVGDGQGAEEAARRIRAENLCHVRLHREWLPESELIARHVATADVCLGIFANRPKALDVVPAKLYLALACGRPVVTADSPAIREEILAHAPAGKPPVLVSAPGDGSALADALVRLRDEPDLRRRLAARGRRLYEERFTPAAVVDELAHAIAELSAPR